MAEAYENSAPFSEHTWGLATQHYICQPYGKAWEETLARGLPVNARLLEELWQEHFDYINRVRLLIADTYADEVSTLADGVDVPGRRVVVYNPLPWKRDGLVEVNACYWPGGNAVQCVDDGRWTVVDRVGEGPLSAGGKIVRFVAKDIPPTGYRTYVFGDLRRAPPAAPVTASADSIESPYFRGKFDPAGGRIASLIDKPTGRELVDGAAPQGFGQYFYERFGKKDVVNYLDAALDPKYKEHRYIFAKFDMPESSYASALPRDMKLHIERSAIDVSGVMTGVIPGPGLPQTVAIRLTLYADMPVAEIEVSFEKQPDAWPEAGWICLPFKIDKPKFRLGRLGGDLDPVTDITVDNANFRQMWINTGVAVYDETGFGVGVCPIDSPLVSLGEPGSHKFSKRYEPKQARIYFNLYNNQWQTNFRSWWGGRLSSRVRLWTYHRYQPEPSLYTPSMESRVPLQIARSAGKPGPLPPTQPGITLSRKGVAITAFGENPDGNGTLLRLWEQAGRSGDCTVRLPKGMKASSVQPVDLRGQPTGKPIPLDNGVFTTPLPSFAPASFLIGR